MLHLHLAERLEPLAERLAAVLAEPLADALAPEWVAVPSQGMRRWLSLALARHLGARGPGAGDGVTANITFSFPGSLRLRVLEAERRDDDPDPWRIERLVWPILEVLDRSAADPLLAPLTVGAPGSSRYSRARRVADLFDRYGLHRAGMIRAWAAGRDLDGAGQPLPGHQAWQPHLWRRVRRHLGQPSPAERMPELVTRLRDGDLSVELPERLALFGLTALPGGGGFPELASAVAATRELHLFLLEPSPAAAERARGWALDHPPSRAVWASEEARARAEDRGATAASHPLLRSWGRLPQETALVVADSGWVRSREVGASPVRSTGARPLAEPRSVLARLQRDLRQDREPVADLRPRPDDRSVEIHACHGPARQVEVLRDAILHCLAEDPSLREDDIVVLCPALERFAPLVEAVFGPSADARRAPSSLRHEGQPPALRYRIADRSIEITNPVVAATAALLELAGGRFSTTAVLDFLALTPVRERYGFGDEDLARLEEWVGETNVRWGLDTAHRARLGVPARVTANTWQAATDRLLTGSAMLLSEPAPVLGGVVPLGVEGEEAVLAGRFAELVWRLRQLAEACAVPRPLDGWVHLLRQAVGDLLAAPPDAGWQLEALDRHLAELLDSARAEQATSPTLLELIDVRRVLSDRLRAAPGRPDFFRGGVTVSSLTPLRCIPHRVVCVLGADQSALSPGGLDGDDLIASAPRFGDRDQRGELRESLLEAVLAAGDRLLVVRDGHDVRTNHAVPAAVPVAELSDAVLGSIHPDVRSQYAARLELDHPRQPFDERCFVPGGIVPGKPWGFDPQARSGAVARRARELHGRGGRPATLARPFLERRLPCDDGRLIELSDLQRFLRHPTRHFLEQRLHLRVPRRHEPATALLPVQLSGLDRWALGDRLLRARLAGRSVERWADVERRLGTLPPAALGDAAAAELVDEVELLVEQAHRLGVEAGSGTALPVEVELGDGTRLVGSVLGRLAPERPGPARVQFNRDKPEHRVAAWLDLMALVAHDPTTAWHSVTVGRAPGRQGPVAADLVPAAAQGEGQSAARAALEVAVDLYRRGSCEPIPLFPKLSACLYAGRLDPADWVGPAQLPGERDDPATGLVFGGYDLDQVRALPGSPDDPPGPGGRADRYARYLWDAIEGSVHDRTGESQELAP